jgi:hypothetical protein
MKAGVSKNENFPKYLSDILETQDAIEIHLLGLASDEAKYIASEDVSKFLQECREEFGEE